MIYCRRCGSKDVIRHGRRKNKLGPKQKYFCHGCDRFFTPGNPISPGYQKEIIIFVINLFRRGYSYAMIRQITRNVYDCSISKSTVYRWTHKDFRA